MDQGSEGILSPLLRRIRLKAAVPHLRGRVLDFGCGSGVLASMMPPESYCGYDPDDGVVSEARVHYPKHNFLSAHPHSDNGFDTVVSMAVIEHVKDPAAFLMMLRSYLKTDEQSRIVLTTPHPIGRGIHGIGSRVGVFSAQAAEEHEEFLDRRRINEVASAAGLTPVLYRRFLFGLNQLIVLRVR